MKSKWSIAFLSAIIGCLAASCDAAGLSVGSGSLRADLSPGTGWMHEYSLLQKNPPQFSLWIEKESGEYVETLYATKKIATEGWVFNGGNRRKEALPAWCHKRGIVYPDGLYLPTKERPLVDALSAATPKAGFSLFFDPPQGLTRFYVCLEINHSTDFNAAYPKDAAEGTSAYSGGKEGSGQPALVYRVLVDTAAASVGANCERVGHSSPDGSDGIVYPDVGGIDSALSILGGFTVRKNN
jgi:hypothetical protein